MQPVARRALGNRAPAVRGGCHLMSIRALAIEVGCYVLLVSLPGGRARRFAYGSWPAVGALAGEMGKLTWMSRPPSGRAFAVSAAPCASAMARTMARPSPFPPAWPTRSVPEALERLEEPVNLAGRDHRSGVAIANDRLSVGGCRGDFDPAAVEVVPDGVVDQVRDQAARPARVTGGRGRVKRGVDADAPALGLLGGGP